MPLPRRPVKNPQASNDGVEWIDPEFVRDYPNLKAFLADGKYADGSVRLTGSISLFTKSGSLTAAINDNDRNVSGFVTAATWAELLYMLEVGIGDDSIDWRARRPANPTQKPPF